MAPFLSPMPIMSSCQHAVAREDTRSVTIEATPSTVFDFVAEPLNLPSWAVGFCRSIRRDTGERWIVTTPSGEIGIRFDVNPAVGTIDFHFTPAPGVDATAYSRVVPNGDGAVYVFTQLQVPGMPDEVFESQVRALTEELQVLRALVHARTACRG